MCVDDDTGDDDDLTQARPTSGRIQGIVCPGDVYVYVYVDDGISEFLADPSCTSPEVSIRTALQDGQTTTAS